MAEAKCKAPFQCCTQLTRPQFFLTSKALFHFRRPGYVVPSVHCSISNLQAEMTRNVNVLYRLLKRFGLRSLLVIIRAGSDNTTRAMVKVCDRGSKNWLHWDLVRVSPKPHSLLIIFLVLPRTGSIRHHAWRMMDLKMEARLTSSMGTQLFALVVINRSTLLHSAFCCP